MSKNHRMPELRIPEMPRMLRAALYIRVSHEEQVFHGYSLEAQHEALTKYAHENNMHIVDYYIDEGKTARKRYTKRKDFMRMLDDVQTGQIDIILFIKLDRWFRNVRDYYKIQDILEKHNVNWRTIFEHYDTSTANGRLHINIMLSVAQDEADRTSERIKFVFENKVKNCEVISGHMAYGYRIENKKLVIEPKEAEVVKEIFNYYLYRQSKHATMTHIKEKYGISLLYVTVKRILSKRLYLGEYRGTTKFCEPIIDQELFDAVQKVSQSNIRIPKTRSVYVYSGLLRCPSCGRVMAGGKTKLRNKDIYMYYRCNGCFQNKSCPFNRSLSEKKLDAYLVDNINQLIGHFIVDYEMKQSAAKSNPLVGEREKIRNKLERLKDLYLDDMIDKNTYKRDYEELSNRLNKFTVHTKHVAEKVNIKALQSYLAKDINKIYETLSPTERQILWRSIIKEIHFDVNTLKPIVVFSHNSSTYTTDPVGAVKETTCGA
jgi:site-specific DNA recombinase